MSRQLPDIVGLGTSLGVGMQKGTLRVDLAEQREAVVEYTNP
jgi:hypothetical protein